MPMVVKERLELKPRSTTKAGGLGVIALLLVIAVAAALLASAFPPPTSLDPPPDANFFAP
jgi:hypothetical protein